MLGTRMHPCQKKIVGGDSEHNELILWVVSLQIVYHMTKMLVSDVQSDLDAMHPDTSEAVRCGDLL